MDNNEIADSKSSVSERQCSSIENCNKTKPRPRGKKRKRQISDDSSDYEEILPDNALLMEKNLHASAVKNNLDETSVRKILKKVVTNDHVLALVKLREEEEDSGPEDNSVRPKLTRAKVKELMKVPPNVAKTSKEAWNLDNLELTPIKHIPVKTRPEVKALIAQELPEDEDDDEYEPTHDDVPSDDDQGLESCSDLESQPRTPATPRRLHETSPKVVTDGPFKVPQEKSTPTCRRLNLEEEATIALRTRSKLSLSSTSIEHIESTFVPPDEVPMPAVDDLWNQFLNECLNPASTSKNEDDDETDPEYNVAADPDANDEDEEALGNSIIKISKKELSDLMTELFNIMPETVTTEDMMVDNLTNSVLTEHSQAEISNRWEGKQEPVSDEERAANNPDRITLEKRGYSRVSIGKSEPQDIPQQQEEREKNENDNSVVITESGANKASGVVDIAIEERDDTHTHGDLQRAPPLLRRHLKQTESQRVTIRVDEGVQILPEQVLILQQQIRQHIQLAASNFLQLYTHPVHWNMAPPYKEYLEALSQLGNTNPMSVVHVVNLKPALELVNTWEKSMCANTPANNDMVKFMCNEMEKCRRRFSNRGIYLGDFHETFKMTVANSPVFLYPHLLPATPYRADHTKRYAYTRSEDELIVLGLDQFWDYIDKNPSVFKRSRAANPRHRWGLGITVQLVVKHMFPWISYNVLMGHIHFVRRTTTDCDNPIYKFFKNRTVTPVKHKLLPFNPNISLYEQPEHEVPKIWVRYLAKTSKRFRNFLLRRTGRTGIAPIGVEVQIGHIITEPTKAPLPIDFTKEIVSNRINVLPKAPKPVLADKFDINITPVTTVKQCLYKLVETSTGGFLMPISNVTTVNSNITPIISTTEIATSIIETKLPERTKSSEIDATRRVMEHCSCCVLLRRICKLRQTSITEYFSADRTSKSCYCKDIKYPNVSNRLRLLVSNYKDNSMNALQLLDAKLKVMRSNKNFLNTTEYKTDCGVFNLDDFGFVTSFHLKLLTRATNARDSQIKKKVSTIFKNFNPNKDDPVQMTKRLCDAFNVELVDVYKEFLCFLTPEQADKCDAFRDYFVRNCVQDLINRVETRVSNKEVLKKLLEKLRAVFYNNAISACEICTEILSSIQQYPDLAQYVFTLFPHTKRNRSKLKPIGALEESFNNVESARIEEGSNSVESVRNEEADDTLREQSHADIDYGTNYSLSKQEQCDTHTNSLDNNDNSSENYQRTIKSEITTSDNEIEPENVSGNNHVRHDSSDSSNNSLMIVLNEETVKSERQEWKRDEDKLILQILKKHLTPEERKDKTILEMIVEKNIIDMIMEKTHKSKLDVTSRILYLLRISVLDVQ